MRQLVSLAFPVVSVRGKRGGLISCFSLSHSAKAFWWSRSIWFGSEEPPTCFTKTNRLFTLLPIWKQVDFLILILRTYTVRQFYQFQCPKTAPFSHLPCLIFKKVAKNLNSCGSQDLLFSSPVLICDRRLAIVRKTEVARKPLFLGSSLLASLTTWVKQRWWGTWGRKLETAATIAPFQSLTTPEGSRSPNISTSFSRSAWRARYDSLG